MGRVVQEPFQHRGIRNTIGLNIVSPKMLDFAFIASFLKSQEIHRLASTLRCSRYLLKQGMAFRGNGESSASLNKGNLLELIDFLKDNNEEVRDAYGRGGLNC